MSDNRCQPNSCFRYDIHPRNTSERVEKHNNNTMMCETEMPRTACDSGWSFDVANHRTSTVTEWDLVCDRGWLREFAQATVQMGILAGTVVVSPLSDRHGRRLYIFIALSCNILFSVCSAFAPYFPIFLICQFLYGGTFVGSYVIAFSYVLEWIGPSRRAFACNSVVVFYSFGYASLAGLAYLIRDWRQLCLVLSLPQIFMLAYIWCIPESPRWLMSRGDIKEAEVIILKAARVNKADISLLLPKLRHYYQEERNKRIDSKSTNNCKKQLNFFDLLRTPVLRKRCLNIFCHWIAVAFVYYGLSLNIATLPGDEYLLFFMAGIVEVPASLLAIFLIDRFGRPIPLCSFFIVAGAGCIGCQFFPEDLNHLSIAVAMIGKLGAAAAFWTTYIYTSELIPTVLRASGLGAATCFGRLGSIFAPFVQLLSSTWKPLSFVVYGCVSILAGMMLLLLPETMGKPLPNTIADVENSSSKFNVVTNATTEDGKDDDEKLSVWASLINLSYAAKMSNEEYSIL
uniref:Organic cation transporter protein-like n=1 Tax=Saccoglossus kowalevskii TaxID=10224 RepID=A0ABM0MVB3_SACKO|nr:PREDICTED: organic cation transporter protein-like [Saccoglossus kowalevskii]